MELLLFIFKFFVTSCVFYILYDHAITDAKPVTKRIMRGKLHRYKRDLDILAECDLQCLSDDEIKDYELLIEYDYGPDFETPNNFYSDEHNKKCSYACKILDVEKTEGTGTSLAGEYSVSFEDGLLSNFRPSVEKSTSSSTTILSSTTSTSTTTTPSTTPSATTAAEVVESNFRKINDSSDELLKQCLDLFAAFGTPSAQNSSDHPCSYFEKKIASTEPTTSTQPSPLSTTESTAKNEVSSTFFSSPTTSSQEPLASTTSTLTITPTEGSNESLVEASRIPDTSQDIALRMLPVGGISRDHAPITQPPKRVIPKVIRYTVVEAEMVEEGSDGNSYPSGIIEIHQIDPEVIKSVGSSMSHISSGLASIQNMSKALPLKHQYELRKPKAKVEINHGLSDSSEIESDEDISLGNDELEMTDEPEQPAHFNSDMEVTSPTPTSKSTSDPVRSKISPTEKSFSFTARGVSLVSESTSLHTVESTTPISRQPNFLYDVPFDAPIMPYKDMPEAHFTRNKTNTFITSQNVTSFHTNQTLESYAYALRKGDGSTTSTNKTLGENNLIPAVTSAPEENAQSSPMANFAARTSKAQELAQSYVEESKQLSGGTVTESLLDERKTANEATKSPVEERKIVPTDKVTGNPLEERQKVTDDEFIQRPLEERKSTEAMASTTEMSKSVPADGEHVVSNFSPTENVTEKDKRESHMGVLETTSANSYESTTEPLVDLNSTTIAQEEFDSSSNETATEFPTETNVTNALKNNGTGSISSDPSSERDFTFSGKFSAKDNSSYPTHFKNTLMENLKKLDDNASVVIGSGNVGENTTTKTKP